MIYYLLFTSLAIIGFHVTTKEGMIFHKLYLKTIGYFVLKFSDKAAVYESLDKMLFRCPPCMASIYGTIAFILSPFTIGYYIPFIFALSGLNYVLSKI